MARRRAVTHLVTEEARDQVRVLGGTEPRSARDSDDGGSGACAGKLDETGRTSTEESGSIAVESITFRPNNGFPTKRLLTAASSSRRLLQYRWSDGVDVGKPQQNPLGI
jgi:hypothetical protein